MASPTFTELVTMVRRDIRDPDTVTFEDATIKDFINAGIAELGRICPKQAVEVIAFVDGTSEYSSALSEVMRVEVWDTAASPNTFVSFLPGAADNDLNSSQAGWELFAGNLSVPAFWLGSLTDGVHSLRVWGWAPFAQLVNDDDTADFSDLNLMWAVREFATVRSFEYLMSDRALFEQWQGQANNTDVSPASLANMLNQWQAKWERRRKQLRELHQLQ